MLEHTLRFSLQPEGISFLGVLSVKRRVVKMQNVRKREVWGLFPA